MVKYSVSEENYIKAIFHLQKEAEKVSTQELSELLKTKPASVTDMMKKLKVKKLIDYKPYYGFSLSSLGYKVALGIVRRHRLWEYFLAEKLNFSWDEVHDVAEDLEHVSSKMLIDKLDAFLGHPKFDPHGDPIPDKDGKMGENEFVCLTELGLNKKAVVSQISSHSNKILELLSYQQITIGAKLEVKKIFSFDGSMEVKIGKNPAANISKQLAKNIFVKI
jgi:DtxR family Mn-dependent transcriptional regulator